MKAAVALGSNLGDRLANLKRAATELQMLSSKPIRKSRLYETSPIDCPSGSGKFLNAAVELEIEESSSPFVLLERLQAIETKLGRHPKQTHNEPRAIDLDLIYCGDLRVKTPELVLPHPRAHLRRFVLQPLCDLSADLVLPGQTETARELLARIPADSALELCAASW